MPQYGAHIYPDTAEGIAAYEAMKESKEGKPEIAPEKPAAKATKKKD